MIAGKAQVFWVRPINLINVLRLLTDQLAPCSMTYR